MDSSGTASYSSASHSLVTILVKWGKVSIDVALAPEATLADLRAVLFEKTRVQPAKQKLMGLKLKKGGKILDDRTVIHQLAPPPPYKNTNTNKEGQQDTMPLLSCMLIGTAEEDLYVDVEQDPSVMNDLDENLADFVYSEKETLDVATHPDHRRRLERTLIDLQTSNKVNIIHPPRAGKPLLVMDLDYTLFDMKSSGEWDSLLRPGAHEFLAVMYEHFEIIIWSQTSWKWLEVKLTELKIISNPSYNLCFVLDKTSMFTVESSRGRHQVKALELIWRLFKGRWNATNTVHVDDVSRNFAMNPKSGLKISAFKNAAKNRATDTELQYLVVYLLILKDQKDFSSVDHSDWREKVAGMSIVAAAMTKQGEEKEQ
jgi:ubiquitin-like domain-containing CTD phosphatase 1